MHIFKINFLVTFSIHAWLHFDRCDFYFIVEVFFLHFVLSANIPVIFLNRKTWIDSFSVPFLFFFRFVFKQQCSSCSFIDCLNNSLILANDPITKLPLGISKAISIVDAQFFLLLVIHPNEFFVYSFEFFFYISRSSLFFSSSFSSGRMKLNGFHYIDACVYLTPNLISLSWWTRGCYFFSIVLNRDRED